MSSNPNGNKQLIPVNGSANGQNKNTALAVLEHLPFTRNGKVVKEKKPVKRYIPPPKNTVEYPPTRETLHAGKLADKRLATEVLGVCIKPADEKTQGLNKEAVVYDASFFKISRDNNGKRHVVKRRDDRVTPRAVVYHDGPPNLARVFMQENSANAISVLLPKVPLNRKPFELKQEHTSWPTKPNQRFQRAVKAYAFPRGKPQFGRYCITWSDSDKTIPWSELDETAAAGGRVVKIDEFASVAKSSILGGPLNLRSSSGDPVVDAYPEGIVVNNDRVVYGDRAFAYWRGKIDINGLERLLLAPFSIYLYIEKEDFVDFDESKPLYVTCILRGEVETVNGVADFSDHTRVLKFIPPTDWMRITGHGVLDAFQAMVPGAPPPVNPLFFQRHSVENGVGFLDTLVYNVSAGHMLGGNIVVGCDYYTGLPAFAYLGDDWTSILSLNRSKTGKTTFMQFLFLQTAEWPIFVALSAAQDESAPGWADDFDGRSWFVDDVEDSDNREEQIALMAEDKKRAIEYAKSLIHDWSAGVLTDLPLVIYPRIATTRYYNLVYHFLLALRHRWARFSAGTQELMEVFLDNFVSILNMPYHESWKDLREEVVELFQNLIRDYLNNGANEHIRLWGTAHTEDEFKNWKASGILTAAGAIVRPYFEVDPETGQETKTRLVAFYDPSEGLGEATRKYRLPILRAELPEVILEYVSKKVNLSG